jgi:hypothetical protein
VRLSDGRVAAIEHNDHKRAPRELTW